MGNLMDLSSRKRRLVAFLIDHFIISFLMVSIVLTVWGTDFMEINNLGSIKSIVLWVMIPIFLLYFSKDSIRGISIGKWIMGIMIRNDSNNEVPIFTNLFVRNLLVIIWPIEFIVLAINKNKKRLGDQIVKTKVLKNPNKPGRLPRILSLLFLGLCYVVFTYYTVGSAMKNSNAYKVAIENIESNKEIINSTGGIKEYGYMPKGNINMANGYGKAQLQIKIMGNKNNLEVYVYLEKEPNNDWIIKEIR